MWYAIFAGMGAAMIAGIIYLVTRVCRSELLRKLTRGNRHLKRLAAVFVVACAVGICYWAIGMINTAVVIVHTLVIWILIDIVNAAVRKKRKKTVRYDYVLAAGILILAVYFTTAWYLAHHVTATRYTVDTVKKVQGMRIVQITDSHVGATFDGDGFAREVAKIQAEEPDLVVITGDFVDDDTSKEDMLRSCEALGSLDTTYGVYFVFGNHDKGYYGNEYRGYGAADLIENLERSGVRVLQDEIVEIADDYYLIGRQDRSEESYGSGRAPMEELVRDLDPDRFAIVLDHQPNDFEAQEKAGVDLVLSGHTHGGQFFPINYIGEWTGENDMTYGIRKRGDTVFEVSSGISDWAIKFKTGCKAEYVVLDIGK